MRVLSPLGKRKRALSNIVAYVLLISITLSLSVMVYSWLRFYVGEEEVPQCSGEVNVIIRGYECYSTTTDNSGRLSVTLKNKGLFNVDGYILRVHDDPDANFALYVVDDEGEEITPGEEVTKTYYFNETEITLGESIYDLSTVTLIEVQPFIREGGQISCQSYASQEVVCN